MPVAARGPPVPLELRAGAPHGDFQPSKTLHHDQTPLGRTESMKRTAIALMTIAALGLASTASAADKKVKIGVTMALFDDVWLTFVRDAMTKWGAAHKDIDLTIVDAKNDSAKQVLAKHPGIKIIREQTGNWQRTEGRTIMENWLASGDKIDAVASNNDEMALGALMAIKAAGKLGKIYVGGTDGSPDALDSMDKGELNMSVYQDPVGQGEGAIEGAYLAAKHQPNPRAKNDVIWIPYQKITKENYKSFMKK